MGYLIPDRMEELSISLSPQTKSVPEYLLFRDKHSMVAENVLLCEPDYYPEGWVSKDSYYLESEASGKQITVYTLSPIGEGSIESCEWRALDEIELFSVSAEVYSNVVDRAQRLSAAYDAAVEKAAQLRKDDWFDFLYKPEEGCFVAMHDNTILFECPKDMKIEDTSEIMDYPSKQYLQNLSSKLEIFVLSFLPEKIKPKREKEIAAAYKNVYNIQCKARSVINDIEISHLLGINDVVIPHLINEYSLLHKMLKMLEKDFNNLKPYGEIQETLKEIQGALETKAISKYLYDDLEHLGEQYHIDFDLKACIQQFKNAGA